MFFPFCHVIDLIKVTFWKYEKHGKYFQGQLKKRLYLKNIIQGSL